MPDEMEICACVYEKFTSAEIGRMLGMYREGEPAGFIMAIVGSVILLYLYRLFAARRV